MIPADLRRQIEYLLGDDVRFDVSMARFTSMRVGGPADALAEPRDRDGLGQLLALAREHGLPVMPIGEGFNTIVTDEGLAGIALKLTHFRALEHGREGELFAEVGVRHARVTRHCIDASLSGLEFAAGIPGSVGGWLSMNAGIGVREMKDVTLGIEWMSADGLTLHETLRDELDFGYRTMRGLPTGAVLLSGRFAVTPGESDSIQKQIDGHMAQRAKTQPIHSTSCGSVFRNPPDDHAGRLIEAAGLKGHRVGGAEVSMLHANFIVTEPGARANDVALLIDEIRKRVEDASGIRLETEVKILGRGAK